MSLNCSHHIWITHSWKYLDVLRVGYLTCLFLVCYKIKNKWLLTCASSTPSAQTSLNLDSEVKLTSIQRLILNWSMNLKFLTIQEKFLCRSKFVIHSLTYSTILPALFSYSMVYICIGNYMFIRIFIYDLFSLLNWQLHEHQLCQYCLWNSHWSAHISQQTARY